LDNPHIELNISTWADLLPRLEKKVKKEATKRISDDVTFFTPTLPC
jgi:hypothetical protein